MSPKRKPLARPAGALAAGLFCLSAAVVALLNDRPWFVPALLAAVGTTLVVTSVRLRTMTVRRMRPGGRSAAKPIRLTDRWNG